MSFIYCWIYTFVLLLRAPLLWLYRWWLSDLQFYIFVKFCRWFFSKNFKKVLTWRSSLHFFDVHVCLLITLDCLFQMGCKVTFVDDVLNRSFYKLGLVVGKQPGYFIIIPVLLTLLMITGYQRVHYEMDPEYLFSPVSGQGKLERRIVEEHFKVNYSHRFNVGRITRPGEFYLHTSFWRFPPSPMVRARIRVGSRGFKSR